MSASLPTASALGYGSKQCEAIVSNYLWADRPSRRCRRRTRVEYTWSPNEQWRIPEVTKALCSTHAPKEWR